MTTVTEIGDRLHALNKVFVAKYNETAKRKMTTRRTWPQNYSNSTLHPFLVPLPMEWNEAGRFPQAGAGAGHQTRVWTLLCILGAFEMGIPTESAQTEGENLLQVLPAYYAPNLKLVLNGEGLVGLVKAEMVGGSGISRLERDSGLSSIKFPIHITTLEAIPERQY